MRDPKLSQGTNLCAGWLMLFLRECLRGMVGFSVGLSQMFFLVTHSSFPGTKECRNVGCAYQTVGIGL